MTDTYGRGILRALAVGVLLLGAGGCSLLAAGPGEGGSTRGAAGEAIAAKTESTRSVTVLRDGWSIKRIESDRPDVAALARSAAKAEEGWLSATMPAQVHEVLLAAGKIPDPRVGKNAAASAWVGEKDWAYVTRFVSPAGEGPAFLRFEGLDTLAAVHVNGKEVGRFDNMHRHWAAEIREHLRLAGERNDLVIVFSSPARFVKEARQRYDVPEGISPNRYLRKCNGDFGSYLGARPHSMKVGVFGDVLLDVPDQAWLADVCVRPALSKDRGRAEVQVLLESAGEPAEVRWAAIDQSGKQVASGKAPAGAKGFEFALERPDLWWPRTHGTPNLYRLDLQVVVDGRVRDTRSVDFGVRSVRPVLEDPKTGEKRFAFEINGQQIFLRGADWAPLEGITHCWSNERASKLLDLVEHGRMNAMRVWGGGSVPHEQFYDECDRRGILIWQDFMYGYGMHPDGPAEFNAARQAEIEDNIRRIRNHPCLLMWCGGNENHMGWNFRHGGNPTAGAKLFAEIMPAAIEKLDPGRFFHPSSPHGGRVPNWPLEGDWHDYSTLKFSPMASVPLFASEIGRVSAPSATSMRRFLSEEELWPAGYDARIRTPGKPAWPEMWQYRSVNGSWDKIGRIEEFCDPTTPEDLVRVLGAAHGQYLQRRVERERRGVPDGQPDGARRCWGNTIWRLNDSWPIIYWSAIDYYLEPKIPYYFLRRAYEPVLVCFERTNDRIAAWIVNDSPKAAAGKLTVKHMGFDGRVRGELSCDVELKPGQSRRCLDVTDFGPVNLRGEFLRATFGEQSVTYLLRGERYLHLPKPALTVRHVDGAVEIATDVFARQVTLEAPGKTGAVFEDNFFDLAPGQKRTIRLVDTAGGSQVSIRAVNAKPIVLHIPGE